MPIQVFETKNTGTNWTTIYSGISAFVYKGLRLYANTLDTYICGTHSPYHKYLSRIDTRPGNDYVVTECNPAPSIENGLLMITHYLNEIGMAQFSVAIEVSGTKMYTSYYPEGSEDWTEVPGISAAGELNKGVDVVYPDTPNSPRFLVATQFPSTVSGVIVILADDDALSNRYSANLNNFNPVGIVTDLETMRFI